MPAAPGTRLCHDSEIAEGACRGFDPAEEGRDSMFVLRKSGRLFAYRDDCPHIAGAYMAWRRHQYLNAGGDRIACHGHGALFDIETGLCVHGPCLGRALQPVPLLVTPAGDLVLA